MKKQEANQEARRAYVEQLALASVALLLAEALEKAGLSQRELAERLGFSEARMSQILHANNNLTVKTLARIADALGLELDLGFREAPAVTGTFRRSDVETPRAAEQWGVYSGRPWNEETQRRSINRGYVERSVNEAA